MWPWQRLMTSRRPAAAPAEIDTLLLDLPFEDAA